MSDSIRMMDLAASTRAIEEIRQLDPEQRVSTRRQAAQAAADRLEQIHRDVPESDRAAEMQVDDRSERQRQRRGTGRDPGGPARSARNDDEVLPEQEEGHLLDIRV